MSLNVDLLKTKFSQNYHYTSKQRTHQEGQCPYKNSKGEAFKKIPESGGAQPKGGSLASGRKKTTHGSGERKRLKWVLHTVSGVR